MRLECYRAESIESTIEFLEKHGMRGKIIAGGTDLLIAIRKGKYLPQALVDITFIPGMDEINYKEDKLKIGANMTHESICAETEIANDYIALVEACSQVGSPQIRNLATVGGNVCNAAPSAETVPALIALGCNVKISGPSGVREVALEKFFKGPSENILGEAEFVTHLELNQTPTNADSAYLRLSPRRALDLPVVNVGVYVELDSNKSFSNVRICLGSVAPTPIRATLSEEALIGQNLSEDLVMEAGRLAENHSKPISDVRGTASYRKEMVGVLTERAIYKAYERALKKTNDKA